MHWIYSGTQFQHCDQMKSVPDGSCTTGPRWSEPRPTDATTCASATSPRAVTRPGSSSTFSSTTRTLKPTRSPKDDPSTRLKSAPSASPSTLPNGKPPPGPNSSVCTRSNGPSLSLSRSFNDPLNNLLCGPQQLLRRSPTFVFSIWNPPFFDVSISICLSVSTVFIYSSTCLCARDFLMKTQCTYSLPRFPWQLHSISVLVVQWTVEMRHNTMKISPKKERKKTWSLCRHSWLGLRNFFIFSPINSELVHGW